MPDVGQIEKKTQSRVVALFRDRMRYDYLGDWTDRASSGQRASPLALRAVLNRGGTALR